MEKPLEKGAEEVARNHGTTFVLKKKGQISWTWKRKSLQGYGQTINLSYRRKVFNDIKSILIDVGGKKLLQQFEAGCFGHLLSFIGGTSCNRALHELISREITVAGARDNELWFRIGKTNIRFAPTEYALVTGFHFGSSTFDPLGSHEMPPEGVFNRLCNGNPISVRKLWDMFNEKRLNGSPEDYLKVAHILALNLMALGYEQQKMVERWVWVLVDDLDAWNRFPWGAYTYKALMHFVSILPKNETLRRGYNFHGPVWALQIWAYEAIPRLGDIFALVFKQVAMPRCLRWVFPGWNEKFPKQFWEEKLDCCVTLEPTDEEKRQPYWLSLNTEQPLGVRFSPGQSQKRGRGVATAAGLSPPRPHHLILHTPLVETSLGEPGNLVEAPATDDSVHSVPETSPRPSCRRNRASLCSSLSSWGRPRRVRRMSELLDEAQFDQLLNRLADRLTDPVVEKLIPHVNKMIEDLLQAREVGNQESGNPGYNTDCVEADEKKEQSFDGGSSSMHNSRKTVDEPAPEDAFGSEEQCEVFTKDPRRVLDTAVAGNGKSFANQGDCAIPNEESRSKRDSPIWAQSDSTQKEIQPPRTADEPESLADPSSSKTKKKKSSSKSKRRRRSPSLDKETSDDEGSESSSGASDPSPSKSKKKKKKKRKLSSTSKRRRLSPPSDDEPSDDEVTSETSSGDERRRKHKKSKRKKRKNRSESSSFESSDSDRHRRRKKKQSDARGSGRRDRSRRPR